MAARTRDRHHRHEREVDDDDADGTDARAVGLQRVVGGNIGVPLSAQVDDSTTDTLHVVEASSFQLEATDTFHPWIAAALNFSPDHLDRHPVVEDVRGGEGVGSSATRAPRTGRW